MSYRDTPVTCEKCGKQFIFTVEEQRRLARLEGEVAPPILCRNCRRAAERTPESHKGTVKWYDPDRGYGFIIQSSGDEIFFHRSGIVAEGPERFKDGAQVTYRVKSTARGPQAVEVALSDAD